MKKRLKLLSLLAIIVLMSGCVKYDIGMEVGKDNSLTISAIIAVANDSSSFVDKDEGKTALEAKGFTAKEYETDDWVGYQYTKKYKNIDDISTKDEVQVDLNDLLDEDKPDVKYYFQKKDSLFKTTYVANFIIEVEGMDSSYMQGAELKYHVTLPSKSSSNNANVVSEDGKTLTWNLASEKAETNIRYEFTKTKPIVYIIIILLVGIVIGLIIFIIKHGKKKNNGNIINNNLQSQVPVNNSVPININTNQNDFFAASTPQPQINNNVDVVTTDSQLPNENNNNINN